MGVLGFALDLAFLVVRLYSLPPVEDRFVTCDWSVYVDRSFGFGCAPVVSEVSIFVIICAATSG